MSERISDDQAERVANEFRRTRLIRRAAAAGRCSFGAARRSLVAAGLLEAPGAAPGGMTRTEDGDAAKVEFSSRKPVVTLEDAVDRAKVDTLVWRVKRWKVVSGEVGMKLRTFSEKGKVSSEEPHTHPVWWVTLELERVLPKREYDALDGLFSRLERSAPKFPAVTVGPPKEPHLMVLGLHDAHFGKLAWAPETGQNYDLRIADRVYRDAVEDLLGRAACYPVEEFLMPLGSDFLHVDNSGGTTTAGTPQDVDGRLAKILEVAEAAVVWAVEAMAERGRVVVRWVPGNHDRTLSHCLARTIKAYFRHAKNVEVDASPTRRKYHRYHSNLIGMTHGDAEKPASLPIIMAQERPGDWAETTCREWLTGHYHKEKKVDFLSLDTHGGIPVRTLPSLSAVDAWHYGQGLVGSKRAAEAYIYSRTGLAGYFVADVRRDSLISK